MKNSYLKALWGLFVLLMAPGFAMASDTPSSEIIKKAAAQLKAAIEQNERNDREGFTHKNNYIIEIELSDDWVEERGNASKVLQTKYESIREALRQFNNPRKDKLRAYVVVVNDWELRLKEHVDVNLLPSISDFDQIAKQTEINYEHQKKLIEEQMHAVPSGIITELGAKYSDIAVYFGARVRFYTLNESIPVERNYQYTSLSLAGNKLVPVKEQIRNKVQIPRGLRLEDQLELGVLSLTEAIKNVVDQKQPLVLANKVANPSIQSWYSQIGAITQTPFSGVTTDQQVYDYTGVFASLEDKIIDQLPDPTAKVVITDNLTTDATIKNIREQVGKALPVNVFWFHLDRKGELHTEIFLAQSVKERLGTLSAVDIARDLKLYIGKLYQEAGPKIKSAADLVDFLNIEKHIFKALNKLLANARIPKDWWDASHPDYLLGIFGKYISPQTGFAFAYVCGLWNGIIDNLSLVSGLLSLKSELQGVFFKVLVDDEYRGELFADLKFYADNIGTLMELGYEMVVAHISKTIRDEWEKLKNGDATSIAYVAGMATIEVVIAVFTAGAVEAVKLSLMSIRLIRVPVEFIVATGKTLVKPLAFFLRQGMKLAFEAGGYVLRHGEEIVIKIYASASRNVIEVFRWVDEIEIDFSFPEYQISFAPQWQMAVAGGGTESIGGRVFQMVKTKDGKFGIKRVKAVATELLDNNGKFIDNVLEENYQKYLSRKAKEGKSPRGRLEWQEIRDYWLKDSPMARGNAFNRKAWREKWYRFEEVYLENGKFVDGYDPIKGEIVSRKATNLEDIDEATFVSYLDEMKRKYSPGTIIKTKKPAYEALFNKPLQGEMYLEIPESNLLFSEIERYKSIAASKGIKIKFKSED